MASKTSRPSAGDLRSSNSASLYAVRGSALIIFLSFLLCGRTVGFQVVVQEKSVIPNSRCSTLVTGRCHVPSNRYARRISSGSKTKTWPSLVFRKNPLLCNPAASMKAANAGAEWDERLSLSNSTSSSSSVSSASSYLSAISDTEATHTSAPHIEQDDNSNSEVVTRKDKTTKHNYITAVDQLVIGLTTTAILLLFAGLISASGPGAWRYYLSGGICAATSHAVTTPIDVVKTRQQVDPTVKDRGFMKTTIYIVKKEGISSLLVGLGPTAFGYLFEGAIKFGIYEVLKPAVRRFLSTAAVACAIPSLNSRVLGFLLCGAVSGVAASVMVCPMEALRIRLVAEPSFAPGGWVDGGLRMLKYEGVRGLWKGMTAMMCKQVPYTITKNVSFDFFTTMAYSFAKHWGYALTAQTKFAVPLMAAMLASILSCISSQPGDMLLSVVNAHEGNRRVRDFAKGILKRDGIRGFFVGTKARFLHVGIIVTVQLLIYDFVKRLCGIAATGSTG